MANPLNPAEILARACFAKWPHTGVAAIQLQFLWALSGLFASMGLHLCSVAVLWVEILWQ